MLSVDAMQSLQWTINRLRVMTPLEVAFRASRAATVQIERLLQHGAPSPKAGPIERAPLLPLHRGGLDAASYAAAADRILQGQWNVFALHNAPQSFPPQWNLDVRTGTRTPMEFGKLINYRDERVAGNIKYVWEPARHLQLSTLAQASFLTSDQKYLEGVRALLVSFFEQCPPGRGVHWTSSLELAIRLVNWCLTWDLVGGDSSRLFRGDAGQAFRKTWLDHVYQHARFIASHLSLHSSANNHLLGEYMGLFIAGVAFPAWPEAVSWVRSGRDGLIKQALAQNFPDGVNREQAVHYQLEVLEMLTLCGLVGRSVALDFPAAFWERLQELHEFIASLIDVAGNVPMIGDADDGRLVDWDLGPPGPAGYLSQLALGAVLFERAEWARVDHVPPRVCWLLGAPGTERYRELRRRPKSLQPSMKCVFPQGGYSILGKRLGRHDEVRLVLDAGPLGYLQTAAHGHADALSVWLSVHGHEVLIDPGTFAYHTEPRWRAYFRGTSAHNTARIDGVDQSEQGGGFLWLRKASARLIDVRSDDGAQAVSGEHDGYTALADPVVHRRTVRLLKVMDVIEIQDDFTCAAEHDVELHWHLAENCKPLPTAQGWRIQIGATGLAVDLAVQGPSGEWQVFCGDETQPLGWISRRFDLRAPSTTLRWKAQVSGTTRVATVFTVIG